MARKTKYYVVWSGIEPGIYDNWEDCEEQVATFPGAKFKSFPSYESAVAAFRAGGDEAGCLLHMLKRPPVVMDYSGFPEVDTGGIAVDAACAGNPGPMEYRGVSLATGREIFRFGPVQGGTNNIGEYLAIVHALALCARCGEPRRTIYSDSLTAQGWVRRRRANTHITPTPANAYVRQVIARADLWLQTHELTNPLVKWQTETWGEIPADFGRK